MWRYRIITFMAYPPLLGTPHTLLVGGSREITLGDKERMFAVRRVKYDESMTPMYAEHSYVERRYKSLQELKDDIPYPIDSPVLDNDNYLKEYEP